MSDILNIIFSIFDFSSEHSINKNNKNRLTKKQKRIAYIFVFLCLVIPVLIIYLIQSN